MKKNILFLFSIIALSLSSCMKEQKVTFEDSKAEFDVAAYNARFGATDFPLAIRVPPEGRAFVAADAPITRATTSLRFRVNLIGAQRGSAASVKYRVFTVGSSAGTTVTFPAPVSSTLTIIEAVPGTHYTALSGTCTIPANSSFGYIDIPVINSGVSSNTAAAIGLELIDGGDIAPSVNYRKVVLLISQK